MTKHSPDNLQPTSRTQSWRGAGVLVGFLLGALLGAGLLWMFTANSSAEQPYPHEEIQRLNERIIIEQAESDTLRGQLIIEQSTIKGLEASLQQGQREIGRLQEQLAFYEQLLPPGPQGAISIRAFDAEVVGKLIRYRVLLQRNASSDKAFEGSLSFSAEGTQGGEVVSLSLNAATRIPDEARSANVAELAEQPGELSDSSNFELRFEQFNRSGGWLTIPEDFVPHSLTVHVHEGDRLRASRPLELAAPDDK